MMRDSIIPLDIEEDCNTLNQCASTARMDSIHIDAFHIQWNSRFTLLFILGTHLIQPRIRFFSFF